MRFGPIFLQGGCRLGPELRQAESPSWTMALSSTAQRLRASGISLLLTRYQIARFEAAL
jgi:hypothetical protein